MIPARHIRAWSRVAPWLTEEQIEQDLVLSRLIVEIANHPVLGEELVFRGGTCLHKVVLPEPLRYSEDLDYVRASYDRAVWQERKKKGKAIAMFSRKLKSNSLMY